MIKRKRDEDGQAYAERLRANGIRLVLYVDPDWVPVDGDAFDAVHDALQFAEIPCYLVKRETV